MEHAGDLRNSPAIISLPMPDGSFQRFRIEESSVLEADMAAMYPEIKSYRGQGIEDGTATVRFDWTPLGFHALILSADGRPVNILPPNRHDVSTYVSAYHQAVAFECGVPASETAKPEYVTRRGTPAPRVAVGTNLRTERIAIAANWEFCNNIGGDTLAGSIAAINAFLNATNAIYEREMSTHMNLVNAPNVIYASNNNVCGPGNNVACTSANDPYTNSDQTTMLTEVRADLGNKVGSANFDLGHVLGMGSAGVAGLGVVCDNSGGGAGPQKAVGASRLFTPAGNSSAVGLWAHELGHQHGANHSFNGTGNICGAARSGSTAWEVGSGSTIMSYRGNCGPDNIDSGDDLRFHNGSYNEMLTYLTASGTCATFPATGNAIPSVNAGPARTIPKQTPFTLTATGTDADAGDIPNLRFVWEQLDAGGTLYPNPPYGDQAGDPNTTTRPLFRAFPPTADKSRTFPSLTYILNNANVPPATIGGLQTAESLPAVSRTMNFRATVRDYRTGVNDSAVVITVDGNSGPFAVTSPNGGGTLSGTQNVTWNVANTNAGPVNTANVKISLSTDGGNTFPTVLAPSVPNNGTASVTYPNGITSSNARVKVEAVGNIYFDISDGNFTVVPADGCPAVSSYLPQAGNAGTSVLITGVNFTGVNAVKFNGTAAASFTVNSATSISATVPAGATGGNITLSKPTCTDLVVGPFSICPNPPVALAVDDGSVESASSIGNGAYYVNRLTPTSYPATLTRVSIYWNAFQSFPPGTAINVVAGANPGGTTNIDNTTLQSFAAAAGAQPGFTTFTLPNPITISAGDFVVGFNVPTDPGFAVAVDTGSSMMRSYRSGNGVTWTAVPTGNYMIRAAQVYSNCSAGAPVPSLVVSRKMHGATPFDIPIPAETEPRSGGATDAYQLVFTFPTAVTFTSAAVTAGAGTVATSSGSGTTTVAVDLTGVTSAQKTTVTLTGVNNGASTGNVAVQLSVLVGDSNNDNNVNVGDAIQVRSRSGGPLDGTTFRSDLNVDGTLNAGDTIVARSRSGDSLP